MIIVIIVITRLVRRRFLGDVSIFDSYISGVFSFSFRNSNILVSQEETNVAETRAVDDGRRKNVSTLAREGEWGRYRRLSNIA